MKINIYNSMIRTINDLKNKNMSTIEDEKINSNMSQIYECILEKYLNFFQKRVQKSS